jgi:hypothetical protein
LDLGAASGERQAEAGTKGVVSAPRPHAGFL